MKQSFAEIAVLYCPCPALENAKEIAYFLNEKKLVACANIIPQILSIYRWENAIEEQTEALLLAKTTKNHQAAIIKAITEKHPYAVPAIVFLPIENGNQEYVQWVAQACR